MKFQCTGPSGQSYDFRLVPIGRKLPDAAGVYVFCKASRIGQWESVYIGKTNSLHDRLYSGIGSHDGFHKAQERGATHIAVMQVDDISDRRAIKRDLEQRFVPTSSERGFASFVGRFA
jgi:excinuclease UvrABC nuclease subunit